MTSRSCIFTAMDPATYRCFPFFVTGGMKHDVLPGYVAAGVLAFGAGFDLILKGCPANTGVEQAAAAVKTYLDTTRQARERVYPALTRAADADDAGWLAALEHRARRVI